MKLHLSIAAFGLLSASANASVNVSHTVQIASNVNVVDPITFQPAPPVDVYGIVVSNSSFDALPITSISLRLNGPFVNNPSASNVSFKVGTNLPAFGPFLLADSFFVVPTGQLGALVQSPGGTIDSANLLAADYSLSNGSPLIPVAVESTILVYSVPTGSPTLNLYESIECACFKSGDEVLPASVFFSPVAACIPEPTTCVLAGLALVGAAARRRV